MSGVAKKTGQPKKLRPKTRGKLVRWDDDKNRRLLVAIYETTQKNNGTIDYGKAGQRIGPNVTSSAVIQHIGKLKKRIQLEDAENDEEDGHSTSKAGHSKAGQSKAKAVSKKTSKKRRPKEAVESDSSTEESEDDRKTPVKKAFKRNNTRNQLHRASIRSLDGDDDDDGDAEYRPAKSSPHVSSAKFSFDGQPSSMLQSSPQGSQRATTPDQVKKEESPDVEYIASGSRPLQNSPIVDESPVARDEDAEQNILSDQHSDASSESQDAHTSQSKDTLLVSLRISPSRLRQIEESQSSDHYDHTFSTSSEIANRIVEQLPSESSLGHFGAPNLMHAGGDLRFLNSGHPQFQSAPFGHFPSMAFDGHNQLSFPHQAVSFNQPLHPAPSNQIFNPGQQFSNGYPIQHGFHNSNTPLHSNVYGTNAIGSSGFQAIHARHLQEFQNINQNSLPAFQSPASYGTSQYQQSSPYQPPRFVSVNSPQEQPIQRDSVVGTVRDGARDQSGISFASGERKSSSPDPTDEPDLDDSNHQGHFEAQFEPTQDQERNTPSPDDDFMLEMLDL